MNKPPSTLGLQKGKFMLTMYVPIFQHIKQNSLNSPDTGLVGRELVVHMTHFSVCHKFLKTMVVFLIDASLHDNTEVVHYDAIQVLVVQKVLLLLCRTDFLLSSDCVSLVTLAPQSIYLVLSPLLSCHLRRVDLKCNESMI